MHKLIERYSYRRIKWLLIGAVSLLTILFITCLVFTILTFNEFNSYTTITM